MTLKIIINRRIVLWRRVLSFGRNPLAHVTFLGWSQELGTSSPVHTRLQVSSCLFHWTVPVPHRFISSVRVTGFTQKTTSLRAKPAFSRGATSNCGKTEVHRCRFKPTAAAQCVITPEVMSLWPLTSVLWSQWSDELLENVKSFVILSSQMEKTRSRTSDEKQSTVFWEQMNDLMSWVENK